MPVAAILCSFTRLLTKDQSSKILSILTLRLVPITINSKINLVIFTLALHMEMVLYPFSTMMDSIIQCIA